MKNELTLNIDYDLNYFLIAIRSKLDDYRFAYFLNKSPFFFFKRMPKDLHCRIDNKNIYFSSFESKKNELKQSSFLIKNQAIYSNSLATRETLFGSSLISNSAFLIPELKEFDYFLKLIGIWKKPAIISLREYLQEMKFVESETNIDLTTIKSVDNLVF